MNSQPATDEPAGEAVAQAGTQQGLLLKHPLATSQSTFDHEPPPQPKTQSNRDFYATLGVHIAVLVAATITLSGTFAALAIVLVCISVTHTWLCFLNDRLPETGRFLNALVKIAKLRRHRRKPRNKAKRAEPKKASKGKKTHKQNGRKKARKAKAKAKQAIEPAADGMRGPA